LWGHLPSVPPGSTAYDSRTSTDMRVNIKYSNRTYTKLSDTSYYNRSYIYQFAILNGLYIKFFTDETLLRVIDEIQHPWKLPCICTWTHSTAVWEIFAGKIFSWVVNSTKIIYMKFFTINNLDKG